MCWAPEACAVCDSPGSPPKSAGLYGPPDPADCCPSGVAHPCSQPAPAIARAPVNVELCICSGWKRFAKELMKAHHLSLKPALHFCHFRISYVGLCGSPRSQQRVLETLTSSGCCSFRLFKHSPIGQRFLPPLADPRLSSFPSTQVKTTER